MSLETVITSILGFHPGMLLARYVLGFLFTLAGASKVGARTDFEKAIVSYELLPPSAAKLTSVVLPWTELLVGALLLFGVFTPIASTIAASLLLSFIAVALLNATRGKEAGCGCFGPRWRFGSGWSTVAARNVVFLVLAVYLLASHLLSPSAAPSVSLISTALGGILLSMALLIGLPVNRDEEDPRVTADVDSDRRRFLRYAAAAVGGAVASILFEPTRSFAQGQGNQQSNFIVVEHEVELPSLAEAFARAPHPLLVPNYIPVGYSLEKVGAFTRGAQTGSVRDVILHYGQDAYHRLTIKFSPKLDGNPCAGSIISRPRIRGYEGVLCKTSPNRYVLSWNDADWHISVVGMNMSHAELLSVGESMGGG